MTEDTKKKALTEDTKKKAKDDDKPKTKPKKKLRKQAKPKKNEGNKDLEEAASATSKANVTPRVEKYSISGKVVVSKTVIKDMKDDAQKTKKKITCRSSRKSKRIKNKSKEPLRKTIAMIKALRSESKCTKKLSEIREEIIEKRENKDKSQKQKTTVFSH